MATHIPWTEETLNVHAGCMKCSPGCRYCQAESWAYRQKCMGSPDYQEVVDERGWTGKIKFIERRLEQPLHWRKPRKIFVDFMSDLFHPNVTHVQRLLVMSMIRNSHQHIFQILTKRVYLMLAFFNEFYERYPGESSKEYTHLQHGVSICTQLEADQMIPIHMQIPSAYRFISFEPLLESINMNRIPRPECFHKQPYGWFSWIGKNIQQIIIGCERKHGQYAGRFQEGFIETARSLIRQADEANVKVFVKQIPVNGIVVTDPKDFPEDLQRREA